MHLPSLSYRAGIETSPLAHSATAVLCVHMKPLVREYDLSLFLLQRNRLYHCGTAFASVGLALSRLR